MKRFDGRLTIAPYLGGGRGVNIRLEDKSSGCLVVEIDIDYEEYGKAMANISSQPVEYKLFDVRDSVGKISQNKEELVPISGNLNRDTIQAAKLVKPFEVDGWSARLDDMINMHRRVTEDGKIYQRVTFFRLVEPDDMVVTCDACGGEICPEDTAYEKRDSDKRPRRGKWFCDECGRHKSNRLIKYPPATLSKTRNN